MAKLWCLLAIENYMFRPIVIYNMHIVYNSYSKKVVKS